MIIITAHALYKFGLINNDRMSSMAYLTLKYFFRNRIDQQSFVHYKALNYFCR